MDDLVLPWDEEAWPRVKAVVAGRGREGEDRRKAFIEAARTGDLPMLRKLLEAGVDIDARDAVRALIRAGADLELRNDDGWTARELAERNGKREAERLLEDAGATRTPTPYDGGRPPWTRHLSPPGA